MEHNLLRPETDCSHLGSFDPPRTAADARWTKLPFAELTNAITEHRIIGTMRVEIFLASAVAGF